MSYKLKQSGAEVQKAIDYALKVPELSEAIADYGTALDNKLPKNFGATNAGKILVVGGDGNLVLTDMPEGGVSGDVVGVLDESNNILLSGDIAEGTYPLKWLMSDGTYSDAGTLTVTLTPKPEVVINWIPNSVNADDTPFVGTNGEKGYKTGYRLSLSSGNETPIDNYEVTGFIPAKTGDVICVKNIDMTQENNTNMLFYTSDKSVAVTSGTRGVSLYNFFVTNGTESDGVYTGKITPGTLNGITNTNVAFIRIGSKSITDESIVTVNQEIV